MIRKLDSTDLPTVIRIVNDGAHAYIGVVPADRLSDPYMSEEHLRAEIAAGVVFWGWQDDLTGELAGVMGIQDVHDVTLVRHAYVQTNRQRLGIGEALLDQLKALTRKPVLIGTWAAAHWAIRFYEKHGFRLVSPTDQNRLLRSYWSIPERQIETSVVLANGHAMAAGVVKA
jgi:GNAT superfamily N-acetyltransferase